MIMDWNIKWPNDLYFIYQGWLDELQCRTLRGTLGISQAVIIKNRFSLFDVFLFLFIHYSR